MRREREAKDMIGDQPQDAGTPGLSPEVEALLARIKTLDQLETVSKRIALLEHVLTLIPRAEYPFLWADLHIKLGDVLQQESGDDRQPQFTRSVDCYDAALSIYTREQAPFNWALTYEKKANALRGLAGVLTSATRTVTLREVVLCYNRVLAVYDPQEVPNDWARVQNSKGRMLRELARGLSGKRKVQALRGSLACFDAAFTLYTPAESPEGWATLQFNKMVVFSALTDELHGTVRMEALRATIACCDAVLTVYTREGTRRTGSSRRTTRAMHHVTWRR